MDESRESELRDTQGKVLLFTVNVDLLILSMVISLRKNTKKKMLGGGEKSQMSRQRGREFNS